VIVIISAPHAFCQSRFTRDCDETARPFAESIRDELKKRSVPVEAYFSDQPRSESDANRIEGRTTAFRRKLDKRISEIDCDDVLLDVHSAPSDTLEGYFDVYLLDIEGLQQDNRFNASLLEWLRSHGVTAYKLQGTQENDIVVRAMTEFCLHDLTIVEINESIQERRMTGIASIIADFIAQQR
jgi:hypothetical protein